MASAHPADLCPILRRLMVFVARLPENPRQIEQGRIIDQLTSLAEEAQAGGAPARTTEAIRSVRRTIRTASLMPRQPKVIGH